MDGHWLYYQPMQGSLWTRQLEMEKSQLLKTFILQKLAVLEVMGYQLQTHLILVRLRHLFVTLKVVQTRTQQRSIWN